MVSPEDAKNWSESFNFYVNYDAPPMKPEQRPACEAWLRSIDFLVPGGRHERQWKAIQKNWIGFLSCHTEERTRLHKWHLPFSLHLDDKEALTERWPPSARLELNRCADGPEAGAFKSLAARWDLEERRRLQTVWCSLFMFLLYSTKTRSWRAMGLEIGMGKGFDTGAVLASMNDLLFHGDDDDPRRQQLTCNLLLHWLSDEAGTTPRTNGLLWWTAVLVRSALSVHDGGGDDYISHANVHIHRLLHGSMGMPMDLDILDRIKALRHYAKVLVLAEGVRWEGKVMPGWLGWVLIERDLRGVNLSWIHQEFECRPDDSGDIRDTSSEEWVKMLDHISEIGKEFLGQEPWTVMHKINRLYADLSARK